MKKHSPLAIRIQGAIILAIWYPAFIARGAEFTSPATIGENDTTYDGQDIVINHTTVTVNGSHTFNSLSLLNGAVLNHSACTASETHKLV